MVVVSFAEVVSLGAIVPFLAALTNPQQVFELPIVKVGTFFNIPFLASFLLRIGNQKFKF